MQIMVLTLLSNVDPGRPRSRAKAHSTRDAAVVQETVPKMKNTMTTIIIPVAPPLEPVACLKISMIGYPVGVPSAASTSPIQNKIARSIANPRTPLSPVLATRLFGIEVEAFSASSHRWTAPSAPSRFHQASQVRVRILLTKKSKDRGKYSYKK